MASDHMQGAMTLSFRREPDYFLGCGVQGDESQIIKCVDSKSGRIVGLGARHSKRLFVNGYMVGCMRPAVPLKNRFEQESPKSLWSLYKLPEENLEGGQQ